MTCTCINKFSIFPWNRTVALVVSPESPMLPTDGLSVDDLDPSSPEQAAGGAAMPLSWGFSWGWGWMWSSESSASCCGIDSCWGGGLWQLAGRPLEDVAHRLASCGCKQNKVFVLLLNTLVQSGFNKTALQCVYSSLDFVVLSSDESLKHKITKGG